MTLLETAFYRMLRIRVFKVDDSFTAAWLSSRADLLVDSPPMWKEELARYIVGKPWKFPMKKFVFVLPTCDIAIFVRTNESMETIANDLAEYNALNDIFEIMES